MIDRRTGLGRRGDDICIRETHALLQKHLEDYDVLRRDMNGVQELLHEINGGLKVLRFIGYILTGGLVAATIHAVQAIFGWPHAK